MTTPFPLELTQKIEAGGVAAVLVVDRKEDAVPLARALLKGGVGVMELTLRTPAALEALREVKSNVPEMVAGIGTILNPEQVNEVVAAGAAFGVSPVWVMILPILTLMIPLFRVAPPTYRWQIRRRIVRWYRDLRSLEEKLQTSTDGGDEAAGADAVLIKGFPAAKLVATIEGLLSQEEKGGAYAE